SNVRVIAPLKLAALLNLEKLTIRVLKRVTRIVVHPATTRSFVKPQNRTEGQRDGVRAATKVYLFVGLSFVLSFAADFGGTIFLEQLSCPRWAKHVGAGIRKPGKV